MGLLGCLTHVGPRALLFALGTGNFHQAVEALCISAGLTQNGSLLQRMGTDSLCWGKKKSPHMDVDQRVLLSSMMEMCFADCLKSEL